MNNKHLFIILYVLLSVQAYGQNIKLYSTIYHDNNGNIFLVGDKAYAQNTTYATIFATHSVAINFNIKKSKYIEFELGRFQNIGYELLDSVPNGPKQFNVNYINMGVRFEYGKSIFSSGNNRGWNLQIGKSIQPTYTERDFKPTTTNLFPSYIKHLHLKFHLVPRINFMYNKHWNFELNFPVTISTVGITSQLVENPAIPLSERKYSIFDWSPLPQKELLNMRIGIGYKL